MQNRKLSLLFVLLLCASGWLGAQAVPADSLKVMTRDTLPAAGQDSARTQPIDIDYSYTLEIFQDGDDVIRKLTGSPARSVELSQDSIYMYCDSALILRGGTLVRAMGNVIIQQGDSLNIFSDSLRYDGASRMADLFGNVILENNEQRLFTDRLRYDLNTKVATYRSGAKLLREQTQLSSRVGYYYVDADMAYFRDSVVVIDPEFSLKADTLGFNTGANVVNFLGPTLISKDDTRIYCEDGFYDMENGVAEFRKNAQYVQGEQQATARIIRFEEQSKTYSLIGDARFVENDRRATADTIRYDELNDKTYLIGDARYRDATQEMEAPFIEYDAGADRYAARGRSRLSDPPQILEADSVGFDEAAGMGLALGNVVWQDTANQLTVYADRAHYDRETGYLRAQGGPYGRPLLLNIVDGDSLYLAADTLLALQDTTGGDSTRILQAFFDVRLYKSDMQAVADSLSFNTRDSTFQLFQDPIVWSDTSQFTADTIHIALRNEQIDRVFLRNKGLIINSPDEQFFNQIKGKNITAYFVDNQIDRMRVVGNAESIYYALDDSSAYIGVNQTICSEMTIFWGDNQVERIRFDTQPSGKAFPMGQIDHNELRLEGFRWVTDRRPRGLLDLFDKPRPKRPPDLTSKLPPRQ